MRAFRQKHAFCNFSSFFLELSFFLFIFADKTMVPMEEKRNAVSEEGFGCMTAAEPVVAYAPETTPILPEDMAYAHIVNNVLQVTPDIEEDILAVERGDIVSLGEFKTMFARWLD